MTKIFSVCCGWLALKLLALPLFGSLYYFNRNEYFAAKSPVAPLGSRAPKIRSGKIGLWN